jgi:hypothetical protein
MYIYIKIYDHVISIYMLIFFIIAHVDLCMIILLYVNKCIYIYIYGITVIYLMYPDLFAFHFACTNLSYILFMYIIVSFYVTITHCKCTQTMHT